MNFDLKDRKVLVIGLGISGRSAVKFLLGKGANVIGFDRDRELLLNHPEIAALRALGLITENEYSLIKVSQFGLVVVSPGIPQNDYLYTEARNLGIETIGEIELACRYITQPVLGITGTNGKTTVTLLVTHILQKSGKPARALGNMGVPLTSEILIDKLITKNEILVVELSSFQLETIQSPVIDAAVILNITPDHLDRYANMEAYAIAKIRIKNCLKDNGKLFIEENAFEEFGHLLERAQVQRYGYSSDCDFHLSENSLCYKNNIEFKFPEQYQKKRNHDLENLVASYALCREMGVTSDEFLAALSSFHKPAHRIQFVRNANGISFYDDSKGTNIDAVIRAVESLEGEIILIAGGVDKGASYEPWIAAFAGKVKCICAIGQASRKMQRELSHKVPVLLFESLNAAVKHATSQAKPGSNVLLSPGCSSFDMFRDYAHRGEEFTKIVRAL